MTKIANPVKKFKYAIDIPEFPLASLVAQKVLVGEVEIAKDTHGDGNKDIKTPGRVTIPDLTIEKLVPEGVPDRFFYDWMRSAQNSTTGNSLLSTQVKKAFTVRLLGSAGQTIKSWQIVGAWPTKENTADIGDQEDGNMIETYVLSIDDRFRII